MVTLDPWWGEIQPLRLHEGLETWGELEVIEHIEAGGRLVDTRLAEYVEESGTIPGARVVSWKEIDDCIGALDPDPERVTVLFCNGPQCAATPRAVEQILDQGIAPERLVYYRGGIHDWVSLGLPTVPAG